METSTFVECNHACFVQLYTIGDGYNLKCSVMAANTQESEYSLFILYSQISNEVVNAECLMHEYLGNLPRPKFISSFIKLSINSQNGDFPQDGYNPSNQVHRGPRQAAAEHVYKAR